MFLRTGLIYFGKCRGDDIFLMKPTAVKQQRQPLRCYSLSAFHFLQHNLIASFQQSPERLSFFFFFPLKYNNSKSCLFLRFYFQILHFRNARFRMKAASSLCTNSPRCFPAPHSWLKLLGVTTNKGPLVPSNHFRFTLGKIKGKKITTDNLGGKRCNYTVQWKDKGQRGLLMLSSENLR